MKRKKAKEYSTGIRGRKKKRMPRVQEGVRGRRKMRDKRKKAEETKVYGGR